MRRIVLAVSVVAPVVFAGLAWARNFRYEISQDFGPPQYQDTGSFGLVDGELFAIHDDEWAAIAFLRPTEAIPAGFDLLNDFDPNVFDSEVLIGGSIEVTDEGDLLMSQVQGLGAVPVWFVAWDDLQDAAADGHLFIEELESMPSLRVGTATFFEEQNHVFGVHPVSHLAYVARGTLEGGGTFDVEAVEVGLELKSVQIDLD
jgi:hypothetical protein